MAKANKANGLQKKKKSGFARSAFGKKFHGVIGRVFCKRSLIILAEHKTLHIPFSAKFQAFGALAVVTTVIWASYSSGSYMAAQKILAEKEEKLASSALETKRVEAEFVLLKSDLMKVAGNDKSVKSDDYAKVIAQHNPTAGGIATADGSPSEAINAQYDAIFKRVEYLNNKVKELQATHDEMVADIKTATGGKIKELERVIAKTGVTGKPLEQAAEEKRLQDEQRKEKYGRIENAKKPNGAEKPTTADDEGGQGGPYIPMPATNALKTKEPELYFNLRRLMVLNDIVGSMPLAAPLAANSYKQTSPFGGRSDPFRGTSAFHSGLDLSGPEHAKVMATNDGKVEFSGWKTGYGNVVDIKHAYGLSTRYAHLERVLVQPEQVVKMGQVIGIQGSTGRSTGHHLHYEVRYEGRAIDPANFLKAGADVRAVN